MLFFSLCLPSLVMAQSDNDELWSALKGSWVRTKSGWANANRSDKLPDYHLQYLKYKWTAQKQLLVYPSYVANGLELPYELNDHNLKIGFGRYFVIEKVDEDELVLVELEGGASGEKSLRFEFVREQHYIDALPLRSQDFMVKSSGDSLFFDSEKFHPQFSHKQYPDFHLYVHNQLKRFYPKGENYFLASFEIDAKGQIDQVQVFAHANQKTTEKAIEAIAKSEGMWQLPRPNGRGGRVLMTIEDRYNKRRSSTSLNLNSTQNDIGKRYGNLFVEAFQKAVNMYVRKQYDQMPEWLARCEKARPDEPNLIYLKYLYAEAIADELALQKHKDLLSKTPLSFLIK